MTDQRDPEWNPEDYVLSFPDSWFPGGALVDMPLVHKADKVREYLHSVLADSVRCARVGAEIPATLAGLAVIDYVAGFYVGRQTKANDYIAFMRRHFPQRYAAHLDAVYANLRCGLMHNLVAANPWQAGHPHFLIVGDCEPHMVVEGDRIVFCVLKFLEDVRRAWIKYSFELLMRGDENPELVTHFRRRFNKLCGIGAFMVKVPDAATAQSKISAP
jgi:hypothetical protein